MYRILCFVYGGTAMGKLGIVATQTLRLNGRPYSYKVLANAQPQLGMTIQFANGSRAVIGNDLVVAFNEQKAGQIADSLLPFTKNATKPSTRFTSLITQVRSWS